MSKKLLALLLTATMAVSMLAGCGAKEEAPAESPAAEGEEASEAEGEEAPAEEPVEEVTLECWIVGTEIEGSVLGEKLQKFNEENEGRIFIDIIPAGGNDDIASRYQMAAGNDSLPDMGETNSGLTVKQWIDAGLLSNMWDYFDMEEMASRFPEGALNEIAAFGGASFADTKEFYGYPTETEIQGWWYNTELFEQCGLEIPTTFDEVLHCVEVFKENDILPIVHGAVDNWATWGYYSWWSRLGMDKSGDDLHKMINGEIKVADYEPFTKTLHYVQQLKDAGAYNDNAASTSNSQAIEIFQSGGAAMYSSGSWTMRSMNESPIADKIAFNYGWDFADGVNEKTIGLRPYSWSVVFGKSATETEAKAKAVAEVVDWLTKQEAALEEVLVYDHFPAAKMEIPEGTELKPVTKVVLEAMNMDMLSYWPIEWGGDYTVVGGGTLNETLNNVITGIIAGVCTAEEGIEQLQTEWVDATVTLAAE